MDEKIRVSVIMPIYNAADYLSPALDSVLDQTLREIEVICVDDGSTDGSLALIKKYQQADNRVRIVTENNAGPAKARSQGIKRARGDYLAFLDADDFFEPDLLELLVRAADRDRLDIAIAEYDVFHNKEAYFTPRTPLPEERSIEPGEVTSKSTIPDRIFQATDGHLWNKLFSRTFITEKGIAFPDGVRIFEDVYFVTAALSLADRIGRVSKVLLHHRVYSGQSRYRFFRKYYADIPEVYLALKNHLMRHGMYLPLATSFNRLVAEGCYFAYHKLWYDARAGFWNLLHDRYADALGWNELTPESIPEGRVFDFAVNVKMYNYFRHIRREGRGLKTKFTDFLRFRRATEFRKKIAAFFGRGKKKENQ